MENTKSRSRRERILVAAEELFAKKGFQRTTIREIARCARCNLSAVSYYFHGKETLYLAVLLGKARVVRLHVVGSIQRLLKQQQSEALTVEMLLQELVDILLKPSLHGSQDSRTIYLFARELRDPHVPPDIYEKNVTEAIINSLTDALQSLYPELSDEQAVLCIESVIAQLRDIVLTQMQTGEFGQDKTCSDMERKARHIVAFSAAGIKQCVNK